MKKKHAGKHQKDIYFGKEGEKTFYMPSEERMLTAEGFRRRGPACEAPRSIGIYRGRRQGKKG